jgi:hypothetical protein
MLAKLKKFSPLLNLIPEHGVQFLDFGFQSQRNVRVSRAFLTEAGLRWPPAVDQPVPG